MKPNSLQQLASRRALLACLICTQLCNQWLIGSALAMSIRRAPFHQAQPLPEPLGFPVWRTLAGCPGAAGTNDGPGVAARFSSISAVATTASGETYVADSGNCTIRKISPQGIVSTVAGFLYCPTALALGGDGNLYIADGHRVRKLTISGEVTTIAGQPETEGYRDGIGTNALFRGIIGLAVDSDGVLYVADSGNQVIRKIDSDGVVTTLAGRVGSQGYRDGAGTNAWFNNVHGLALDTNGILLVADSGYDSEIGSIQLIRKINPDGLVTTWVGEPGKEGYYRDGQGTNAWFNGPSGLAIDKQGNVYVTETGNRCIRKVSPEGVVSTLGGNAGAGDTPCDGSGPFARFRSPNAIAVDSSGHLLVADSETIRYGSLGPEPRPLILQHPTSQTAELGAEVTFSIIAQSNATLRYQWLANGEPIASATNATLVLSNLDDTADADYRVSISDGVGFILSRPASLRVQRLLPNPLDNWRRFAAPPLREIHGLAHGNGCYVAIGGGYSPDWLPAELRGSVATSIDGENWIKQFPITSECLNDVAFGNGTFVTVGNNGTVFTSTNGVAWKEQTLTPEGLPDLHGITFDQGLFVAVSGDANGSIWTSTNGYDWTNRGIDFGVSFMAVAAQDGRFIAVGNTIMTSTNGLDWEPVNLANLSTNFLGQEITLEHIACGNGRILVAEHLLATPTPRWGNGVLISSNGLEWQDAEPTNVDSIGRVTFGNGQFLAVEVDSEGRVGISVSTDGLQWSEPVEIRSGDQSAGWYPHLCFEQGLFVATGDGGTLFTSGDGISWAIREQQQSMPFLPDTIIQVEDRWFGAGWAGVITTTNGANWSSLLRTNLSSLAYGDGKLVAVGYNDLIFSSEDGGETWTDRSPHLGYGTRTPSLSHIAFGKGVFVAIGSLSTSYPNYTQSAHMLTSSNLVTWTAVDFPSTSYLSGVAYGAGLFVALLNRENGNREILISTNGVAWSTAATSPTNWFSTVAYGNNRFVVGTWGGTVTSPDGKTWSQHSVPDTVFDRIVYGNGLFLARGYSPPFTESSVLVRSSDGITWTPCETPRVPYFQTMAVGEGIFFAVGEDAILYQSGPIQRLGNPRWLSNTSLEWTVTGAPHADYRVDFSEDLLNWQMLTRIVDPASASSFVDPDAATRPTRFYRVVTE